MDLHEDIHRAIESYLDANEFRRCLNSAIQNSRGVTFLLQKRKSKWKDFDDWYGAWQADAELNPIASWGVRSRNRIVKEEDLQTFSQAIISFYGERLLEVEEVLTVPSDITVDQMLTFYRQVATDRPEMRKGWIRIQRRWIDDQLPEHELVSALRELYRVVAHAVELAHAASNVAVCQAPTFQRPCVNHSIDPALRCLGDEEPLPTGLLNANTGEMRKLKYGRIEHDDDAIRIGKERYGLPPKFSRDPIDHAYERLEMSKTFLEADGYAGPMLLLSRGDDDIRLNAVLFGEDEPRELKIAAAVDRHGAWLFDGAVFSSETWTSMPGHPSGYFPHIALADRLPSSDSFFDSDPAGGRDEALVVFGLSADGRSCALILPYVRTKTGVVYGELFEDTTGEMIPTFMRPILRRWPKWRNDPRLRHKTYKHTKRPSEPTE